MKNTAKPLEAPAPFPAYKIRKSKRAKRVGLRVLPGRGLEVVLPFNADPACVPDILCRYKSWIARALERMASHPGSQPAPVLPAAFAIKGGMEEIVLFPDRVCPVDESARPGTSLTNPPKVRHIRLFPETSTVMETPDVQFVAQSVARLREWVREEARDYLGAMLAALAQEHGFTYHSLSIRFQRTRWGSCSARGNINLNACLLFLPGPLVRYILLHELCHTRQLNHSERYWKHLFAVEPEALALDKAMRRAWHHVPSWIFAGS